MRLSPHSWNTLVRVATFVFAYLNLGGAFHIGVFTIYQNALRVQFHITQYDVSMATAFCGLGSGFCNLCIAFIVHHVGNSRVIGAALVFNVSSMLLLWQATHHVDIYERHPALLWLYFGIAGFGVCTTTVASLNIVGLKFPARYSGSTINSLSTATNIGPMCLILMYNYVFMNDGSYESQDISSYFLSLAIYFLVVNLLAVIVYQIPLKDEDVSESTNLLAPEQQKSLGRNDIFSEIGDEKSNENVCSLKGVLRSPRFHLTVWPAGILLGLKFIGLNNISTILNSYDLSKYEANSPFIPAGAILFKPLIGFLSDYTKERFSGAWYLLAAAAAFIFWFIVAIFALDNFVVFCFVIIMWCVAADTAYVQPGIFMEEFGKKYLGMNMSCIMCTSAFFIFIPQAWFSAIYKAHAGPDGLCYDSHCFTLSFLIGGIVAAACGVCFCCYLCLRRKQRGCRKEPGYITVGTS